MIRKTVCEHIIDYAGCQGVVAHVHLANSMSIIQRLFDHWRRLEDIIQRALNPDSSEFGSNDARNVLIIATKPNVDFESFHLLAQRMLIPSIRDYVRSKDVWSEMLLDVVLVHWIRNFNLRNEGSMYVAMKRWSLTLHPIIRILELRESFGEVADFLHAN
jgi:hypothetical protein